MLRFFFLLSIATVLFSALVINDGFAQDLAPGKLVQIRQMPEYPFGLLSLDSLIGREYILVSTTLRDFRFGGKSSKSGLDSGNSDLLSLRAIFLQQPDPDSLLAPWIGKRFRIINVEKDTSYIGLLSTFFIQAKFLDGDTCILKVSSSNLRGDESKIVSIDILDSARKRWIGKYLWTNVQSDIAGTPVFSRVKVLDIDAVPDWRGPIAFHILSEKNDTVVVNCKLQTPDTPEYDIGIGRGFGKQFLDGPPSSFWKTVPDSSFDYDGIALGEDSSSFFKTMARLYVRTQSYNVTYSMSGQDSEATAELRGKGIWGIPSDTCTASFDHGKLSGISFMIFDSISESRILKDIVSRLGNPTIADSSSPSFSLSKIGTETWMYYSPHRPLSQIYLMDMGSMFSTINNPPKTNHSRFPSILLPRAMLFYGTDSMKP